MPNIYKKNFLTKLKEICPMSRPGSRQLIRRRRKHIDLKTCKNMPKNMHIY